MRDYIENKSGDTLSRTNKLVVKIAKKTGMAVETIYRAAIGDRIPSVHTARKIKKATGGDLSITKIMRIEE